MSQPPCRTHLASRWLKSPLTPSRQLPTDTRAAPPPLPRPVCCVCRQQYHLPASPQGLPYYIPMLYQGLEVVTEALNDPDVKRYGHRGQVAKCGMRQQQLLLHFVHPVCVVFPVASRESDS